MPAEAGCQKEEQRRCHAATVPVCAHPHRLVHKSLQATRALFGGGAATKGSIYDYTVKSIDGKVRSGERQGGVGFGQTQIALGID